MRANYHTHTPRCHHACGTEEEYVQSAIGAGLKILGFSDHTPYPFSGSYKSNIRMDVAEFPEYAGCVKALREKYADKLQIHLGVEAEYYPKYFPALLDILRAQGTEYLLLGQHFLYNEEDGRIYAGAATTDEGILRQYCDQAIEGLYTGMFSCFAHPDLIHYLGDAEIYRSHMRRLCVAAKKCNVPLEMNLLGLMGDRHYPNGMFWEIAAEEGCPMILGVDAHQPRAFGDTELLEEAAALIAHYGLNCLEILPLRPLV